MDRDLILVVNGTNYYKPFAPFGKPCYDPKVLSDSPERVRLVVFTGGSDVHPSMYGDDVGSMTGSDLDRDIEESVTFRLAHSKGIPMAGICRGSQFLCVMCGGKLVQDVTNHGVYRHEAKTHDGRIIRINSTHHQMAIPPAEARILCHAEPTRSRHYLDGRDREIQPAIAVEPEAVYYPLYRALGMQWHPETMEPDEDGFKYCEHLVREFLLSKPAAR